MVRSYVILSAWYTALYEEDCIRVMELLREWPQLLKHGWAEDRKRVVEGRFSKRGVMEGRFSKRSAWKGRTALHVGARRGCLQLVTQLFNMFDDEGSVMLSDEVGPSASSMLSAIFLGDLLAARDGEYKLDALAMAVVNGKQEIIRLLCQASFKSESNPFEISRLWEAPGTATGFLGFIQDDSGSRKRFGRITQEVLNNVSSPNGKVDDSEILKATHMQSIRRITQEVMNDISSPNGTVGDAEILKGMYRESRDLNFLPWEEYLFHYTLTHITVQEQRKFPRLDEIRQKIFMKAAFESTSLLRFLCELQDGQGRTALHLAVEEGTVQKFLSLVPQRKDVEDFLNTPDGVGRTPLHRAASMVNSESLSSFVADCRVDLNVLFFPWEYAESLRTDFGCDLEILCKRNGFKGFGWFDVYDCMTALHIAIIHKRRSCVELLLRNKYHTVDMTFPFTCLFATRDGEGKRFSLEPLQLAALLGDAPILRLLLEDSRARDAGRPSNWPNVQKGSYLNPWPALHLVAASGNFELLKLFMDSKYYDPRVMDIYENTTLHHAARGNEIQFDTVLIDYVTCRQAAASRLEKDGQDSNRKGDVERQGCIELLLQAGFDIWMLNKEKQAPYPGPDATAKVLSWWYKKLGKETIAAQNTLNAAANAISVTGALVATASFVGPLQPPLGNDFTVALLSVRMFIVFDTLSFYLAVSAVMLALMPALPMRHESMTDELRRTQRMVAAAVGFLFPSLICVIIAFGAASIAVVPNSDHTTWNHGGLTLSTCVVGGLICLGVMFLFFVRLMTFYFHTDHVYIRKMFKFISL